jgi:quercetin dioxygenase-like cupin family protein
MDKKWRVTVCLGLGVALTVAALAFQQTVPGITFLQTVTAPLVLPPPPVPTVMQFQKIILKQGATTGWHHHDGPAWVILENGSNVVETHCGGGSEHLQPGTAFIEPIGLIHMVENYGPGEATITWATTYPQGGSPIVEEADQSHPCPL